MGKAGIEYIRMAEFATDIRMRRKRTTERSAGLEVAVTDSPLSTGRRDGCLMDGRGSNILPDTRPLS